jgi:hypothetical protein
VRSMVWVDELLSARNSFGAGKYLESHADEWLAQKICLVQGSKHVLDFTSSLPIDDLLSTLDLVEL